MLVLSNSLGTNMALWDEQMPALTARYRVLRYDTRGHGSSPVTTGPYSIAMLASDLLVLLDAFKIERAHFCGLSLGGMTGMWLGVHAAERIDRLVLANTAPRIGAADIWNARIDAVRRGGMQAIADSVLERWFTARFRARAPESVGRVGALLAATPPEGYVACCAAIRDADLWPRHRGHPLPDAGHRRDARSRHAGGRRQEDGRAHRRRALRRTRCGAYLERRSGRPLHRRVDHLSGRRQRMMRRARKTPCGQTRTLMLLCAVLCLPLLATAGTPASYPVRPIRIVVPYTPGTGIDILARVVGQQLAGRLKVAVVVDNRPGASGNIGTEAVSKAAADGYVLLMTSSTHVLNAALQPSVPYDPVKGFTPIGPTASASLALVVNPSLPARSVQELVALAKAEPGKLNYASPGNGTPHHLAMELFKRHFSVDITHVPYNGTAGAVTDLLGGQVQVMFLPVHVALPLVQSGRLRMLSAGGAQRSPATPDVPSLADEGVTWRWRTSSSRACSTAIRSSRSSPITWGE